MAESNWDEDVVLDPEHLRGFSGGDTDFEAQILGVFAEKAPDYLVDLAGADASSWRSYAHKLKGAARSIGAWRLARQAERAEHQDDVHDDDARKAEVLRELNTRLQQLLDAIKERGCEAG
ncbi:Hpt domain-containing protein [Kordiimonas sp.]|uniref:Hpt domain-containing protein n=1 Tax=Kordiimonas sp. TaxID=1970157 RepID=UPI003A8FD2D4